MKFTVNLSDLTRENVEKDCPFIVREIDKEAEPYTWKTAENIGLLFDTMEEALIAAKRLFWRSKAAKLSRPWKKDTPNATIYYNSYDMRLLIQNFDETGVCGRLPSRVDTQYWFDSELKAYEALQDIGELNYAKYVLGLTGIQLLVSEYL